MKKTFLSIIMAVLVVMSAFSLPTFAYSHICEDINFNKFNSSDWSTSGARYGTVSSNAAANGTWITYSAATNDRDGDGKSLKLAINANSAIKTNPGFKYTLPENEPLKGIIHISASHYIEKHDKTGYMPRTISMVPVNGSAITLAQYTEYTSYTYIYSNGENKTGTSTKVPWTPGAWNDIDIWYNLNDNSVTYKLACDGVVSYNKSFVNANDAFKDGITEIKFYTQTPNWLSTRNDTFAKSTTVYWDNLKVETLDKMPSETAKTNVSNFNSYTPSSSITSSMPSVPSGVTWVYANANGKGVNYEATDKGVSLRYTGSTSAAAQLRMNFSPYVSTVKSKFSAQVADKVSKPIYIITGDGQYVQSALFHDGGYLIMFGKGVLQYKLNHWYDIEYSYNAQNGDYFYRVNDGENEYIGSGVFTQSGLSYPNNIQRVMFQVNKSATASSILVDDFMLDTVASDFRLDADLSTNNKTIKSDETVYARFTNVLNESPETLADKVFEYYNNADISAVSLIDNYTVKVDFEKEKGKKYRIDFKNIVASDGSATSDYIEFDVKKEELEMTDVIYTTADDEILSLIKPGTIKASFNANSNNGKTFNYLYVLGLFSDGELVSVKSKNIDITETRDNYYLDLSVPSDGKVYIAKTFIWDEKTLEPVVDPATLKPTPDGKPVAIVKMDDLRGDYDHYLNPFIDMIEWADSNGIRVSTGLIALSLDTEGRTDAQIAKLETIKNAKNNEIWFHGYENPPSTNLTFRRSKEEQKLDFEKGIEAGRKNGITFTAFNPPSNAMNTDTVEVINEYFPNFKAVVNLANGAYGWDLENAVEISTHIKVEPSAIGQTDTVENLKALWNAQNYRRHLVLQVHPASWASYEGSKERFQEFLLWLKGEGVVFMTPTEYAEYVSSLN